MAKKALGMVVNIAAAECVLVIAEEVAVDSALESENALLFCILDVDEKESDVHDSAEHYISHGDLVRYFSALTYIFQRGSASATCNMLKLERIYITPAD